MPWPRKAPVRASCLLTPDQHVAGSRGQCCAQHPAEWQCHSGVMPEASLSSIPDCGVSLSPSRLPLWRARLRRNDPAGRAFFPDPMREWALHAILHVRGAILRQTVRNAESKRFCVKPLLPRGRPTSTQRKLTLVPERLPGRIIKVCSHDFRQGLRKILL